MSDTAEALARALRNTSYEAGGSVGYGKTYAPTNFTNLQSQVKDSGDAMQAYALARNPYLGLEAGMLKLPDYHSNVYTGNYPAYKGVAAGAGVPQTASATQDITATAPYARLNLYGPNVAGMEPYGFYGRARVRSDNHENALYDGTQPNDFREVLKRNAPYYGLGVNAPLGKNMNLRAEYGRIPQATVGDHTGNRDISMGLLGLGYKW